MHIVQISLDLHNFLVWENPRLSLLVLVWIELLRFLQILNLLTSFLALSNQGFELLMVSLWFLHDKDSPVNAKDPSNEINGSQELEDSYEKLCLVHVFITETCANHSACARDKNIKCEAKVSPYVLQLWNICEKLPCSNVSLRNSQHGIHCKLSTICHLLFWNWTHLNARLLVSGHIKLNYNYNWRI